MSTEHMAVPGHRVETFLRRGAFAVGIGLGAVAVHEMRRYNQQPHKEGILEYAKQRIDDISTRFDEHFSNPSTIVSSIRRATIHLYGSTRNFLSRHLKKDWGVAPINASSPATAWSQSFLHKPKFSNNSMTMGGDSQASERHPDTNEDNSFIDVAHHSIGVFDGVGGYYGSATASRIATETVRERLASMPTMIPEPAALEGLRGALQEADRQIVTKAPGTATTGVIAKICRNYNSQTYAAIAAVADSRAYLVRNNKLYFLTFDEGYSPDSVNDHTRHMQTKLASVTKASNLTSEEAFAFKHRNYINSSLGDNPVIITSYIPLQPGDRLLLTSDGIHDNLTTEEIENLAASIDSDRELSAQLTKAAQKRSRQPWHLRAKPDDMTAVALTYRASETTIDLIERNGRL